MKPEVSIVVTCYNYAQYVGQCLDSILDQSYHDYEIIVVNDGSIDDSDAVKENT
jgi:glycosyltransferase involved in cell wall biosynthesis